MNCSDCSQFLHPDRQRVFNTLTLWSDPEVHRGSDF